VFTDDVLQKHVKLGRYKSFFVDVDEVGVGVVWREVVVGEWMLLGVLAGDSLLFEALLSVLAADADCVLDFGLEQGVLLVCVE